MFTLSQSSLCPPSPLCLRSSLTASTVRLAPTRLLLYGIKYLIQLPADLTHLTLIKQAGGNPGTLQAGTSWQDNITVTIQQQPHGFPQQVE